MNRFDPAALDAYVTYGFVDDSGRRTVTLACAREDEATVYEGAPRKPRLGAAFRTSGHR